MGGGGIGWLQFLLLGRRLLIETPEAALAAPVKPTGNIIVVTLRSAGAFFPLKQLDSRSFGVYCLYMW